MNDNLKKIINLPKDKITIIPHDNIDVDAILSSILLSKIFDYLEIQSEIVIFDKIVSKDTMYILSLLGIDISSYMSSDEDEKRKIFLVDHYETIHSGRVIGVIDHHPNNNNFEYDIYEYKNSCATAYIIYEYMLELKMDITPEIVQMVGFAMLVDTCSFNSSKTDKKEAELFTDIIKQYGFNFDNMCEISYLYTDIYNMSMDEIITNGLKIYDFKQGKVRASYMQVKKSIDKEKLSNILSVLRDIVKKDFLLEWVYIVYVINKNEKKTYVYDIFFDGIVSNSYGNILSRGNDIIPILEKKYNI